MAKLNYALTALGVLVFFWSVHFLMYPENTAHAISMILLLIYGILTTIGGIGMEMAE